MSARSRAHPWWGVRRAPDVPACGARHLGVTPGCALPAGHGGEVHAVGAAVWLCNGTTPPWFPWPPDLRPIDPPAEWTEQVACPVCADLHAIRLNFGETIDFSGCASAELRRADPAWMCAEHREQRAALDREPSAKRRP